MGVWIETTYDVKLNKKCSVTPRVGVWIETNLCAPYRLTASSLPAWECGLKLKIIFIILIPFFVTPRVGVWIETIDASVSTHL